MPPSSLFHHQMWHILIRLFYCSWILKLFHPVKYYYLPAAIRVCSAGRIASILKLAESLGLSPRKNRAKRVISTSLFRTQKQCVCLRYSQGKILRRALAHSLVSQSPNSRLWSSFSHLRRQPQIPQHPTSDFIALLSGGWRLDSAL